MPASPFSLETWISTPCKPYPKGLLGLVFAQVVFARPAPLSWSAVGSTKEKTECPLFGTKPVNVHVHGQAQRAAGD